MTTATRKPSDGGPAFPLPHASQHIPGISVRDWFAGQVAAGVLANPTTKGSAAECAAACYLVADALLSERAK